MNTITVIIPTYNEEYNIFNLLNSLEVIWFWNSEIIVVDWSENDLTRKKVDKISHVKFIKNPNSSRASSMNIWAKEALWNLLIFLHADSFLPENAFFSLSNLDLEIYNYWWFYKKFSPNNYILKILSNFNNKISLSIFYNLLWDNAIFVSKKLFNKVWWYRNIRLMEDVELSKILKIEWNIKIIKDYTVTSSRKFQKRGVISTILFMQYIRFLYLIRVNPDKLEKKYKKY